VAIMIAILLPALAGVRQLMKNLECRNNLKQIATSTLNYITDYKGVILPTRITRSNGDTYWWYNLLAQRDLGCENTVNLADGAKTQQSNVLLCPVSTDLYVTENDTIDTPQAGTAQGWYRGGNNKITTDCSYFWNGYVGSNAQAMRSFPSLVLDESNPDPTARAAMVHDISEVRQRSTMAMVADGVFFMDDTFNLGRIAARHSGGKYGNSTITNIAFYDGHVDAMDRYIPKDWANSTEDDPDDPAPALVPIKSMTRTTPPQGNTSVNPLDWGPPWFLLRQPR